MFALLPIAALTGAFEGERELGAQAGDLELEVLYPQRMRHGTVATLEIRLVNRGKAPLVDAMVHVPEQYLSHFGDLRFLPQPQRLDEQGVQALLGELAPGQTRKLVVALKANRPGVHDGRISASAGDGAAARIEVETLVLP
ncbi:MAG TPA: hypothetical protein PK177_12875 [Burkholderiaceae bacterium]|nr:hypothetical protein [Burkholderiaceae bacterium]